MFTVVEYYRPYWSKRELPRPIAFENRNDAIKSASKWAGEVAVDKLGTFEARHLNECRDISFIVIWDDLIGDHSNEVALLFDVELM